MRYFVHASLIATMLAGCTPPPQPVPVVKPVPVIVPAPRPSPTVVPLAADWRDWPFTPGDWVYRRDSRGSIAVFGAIGGDAQLSVRCDRAQSVIYISMPGPATATTLLTSSLTRTVPLQPTGVEAGFVGATLAPTDALLDAVAFSRGRFVVERAGQAPLVLPAYAEVGRVIEDCRG